MRTQMVGSAILLIGTLFTAACGSSSTPTAAPSASSPIIAPDTVDTNDPPITPDRDTDCTMDTYGQAVSGVGTSVFLNSLADNGPYRILIHRTTDGDRTYYERPRFDGATVIEATYDDIPIETVTSVEVADGSKNPCTIPKFPA